jgi:hypothetical protein
MTQILLSGSLMENVWLIRWAQHSGHRGPRRIPETRGIMKASRIPVPTRLVLEGMYPDPASTSLPGLVGLIIFHDHVQRVCTVLVASSIHIYRVLTEVRSLLRSVQCVHSSCSPEVEKQHDAMQRTLVLCLLDDHHDHVRSSRNQALLST